MKQTYFILILVLFLNAFNTKNQKAKDNDTPPLEDLYFSQKTLGLTPEVFVPNSLSTNRWELGGKFSTDIKEFYFTSSGNVPFAPTVVIFRKENNVWKKHNFHSALSDDSNILCDEEKYMERTETGW